jgi:hypothetical protein
LLTLMKTQEEIHTIGGYCPTIDIVVLPWTLLNTIRIRY